MSDVCLHATAKGHIWVCGSINARVCDDVHGLFYHRSPCRCPWSVLLACRCPWSVLLPCSCPWAVLWSKVILISVALSPRWCLWSWLPPCLGLWSCCSQGPCSWSVLSPESMWKPTTCDPAGCKEQGSYFCRDIDEKEGHGRLL